LLSGTTPTDPAQFPMIATVTLSEPEKVAEDEDESEAVVDEADLPAKVLEAFRNEFGNAEIDEITFEEDDERGTEYDITAQTEQGEVEVTISPIGQIVETERTIDPSELPQDVIDKLQATFQGAEITGAADLGNGLYDLEYTFGGEEFEVEAARSEQAAPPAPPLAEEPPAAAPVGDAPTPTQFADASTPVTSAAADPIVDAVPSESPETPQMAQADNADDDEAQRRAREDAIKKNATAKKTTATTIPADRLSQALENLAAGAGATVWLPQVAGAMVDVLPIDVDGIERGLQDVLRQFGTLAGGATAKAQSSLVTGVSRLAMGATLVAAIKVLLDHSKKGAASAPVLSFGPVQSSWGWMLGTTSRNRRRISSRQRET
jgi:hypothetical protein